MKKLLALILSLSLCISLNACMCIPANLIGSLRPGIQEPALMPTDASQAPTMAPTAATEPVEATEPTEAPPEVLPTAAVETVIDYTRKITDMGGTTTLTHHTVRCPALAFDTPDARFINQEMYEICHDAVQTLENYQEGEFIYLVDYTAFQHKDLIAIVLNLTVSLHYGAVMPSYRIYYYNAATGEQLFYEDYLNALNITEDQIRQLLDNSGLCYTTDYSISWAAMDASTTYIMARSPEFMDDQASFIVEDSLVK